MRHKVDDLPEPGLFSDQCDFCPEVFYCIPYLVCEIGILALWFTTFLYVKVSPFVQGFDRSSLAPFSREQYERDQIS